MDEDIMKLQGLLSNDHLKRKLKSFKYVYGIENWELEYESETIVLNVDEFEELLDKNYETFEW